MKKTFLILMLLFVPFMAMAHGEETFEEAEILIGEGVSCDDLSNEQLEIIGDYYMEQMHPGELHERMDERMGGEGSESLRLVHINMAKRFYCGDYSFGMMGYGMMGRNFNLNNGGNWNMINGYYGGMMFFGWIFGLLILIALILLIVWLWQQIQKNEKKNKSRK